MEKLDIMTSNERYEIALSKFNELRKKANSLIYNKVYIENSKKKEYSFNLRELNKHLFK